MGPTNKFLLARYVGVATLPTYDIITNGSLKIRSLMEAPLRSLMPEISRLAAKRDYEGISQLTNRVSSRLLYGGAAAFAVMLVVCGLGVKLWLGELASHFPVGGLRVVLVGTFFSLLAVPPYYTLLGLSKSSTLLVFSLIQSWSPILFLSASLLLGQPLSLGKVLASVASGMIVATVFIKWQNQKSIKSLSQTAELEVIISA